MKNFYLFIFLICSNVIISQSNVNYYVNSNTLNFRSAPSTSSIVLEKLNKYDNLKIINKSIKQGWDLVNYNKMEGYVASKYISEGKAIVSKFSYRIGATCKDGTSSSATGRGACSHHGGVLRWRTRIKTSAKIVK